MRRRLWSLSSLFASQIQDLKMKVVFTEKIMLLRSVKLLDANPPKAPT
jgi:hypothetical protein